MMNIVMACFVLLFLLAEYFMLGLIIEKKIKLNVNPTMFPVIGFTFCMVFFHLIAIPLQLMQVSLSCLTIVYCILFLLALIMIVKIGVGTKISIDSINIDAKECVCIGVIILLQCAILWVNMAYGSTWDTGQYIGEMTTNLYTNTIGKYDPYTGNEIEFVWQNSFFTYELHGTVLCKIFHMHPLIYFHRIMAPIEMIMANLIGYNIALSFLKENKVKAMEALIIVFILNLFSYTSYSWSGFLFLRAGESKSILANVILPLLLYWFIRLLKNEGVKSDWIMLFLSIIMGLGMGKSVALIIPIELAVLIIPTLIIDRRKKWFVHCIICALPCIAYFMIVYLWEAI